MNNKKKTFSFENKNNVMIKFSSITDVDENIQKLLSLSQDLFSKLYKEEENIKNDYLLFREMKIKYELNYQLINYLKSFELYTFRTYLNLAISGNIENKKLKLKTLLS